MNSENWIASRSLRGSADGLTGQQLAKTAVGAVHTPTFMCSQVSYDVAGFLDKNKDLLFKDLSQAMFACERGLLKRLFPEGGWDETLPRCVTYCCCWLVQWCNEASSPPGDSQCQQMRRPHTAGYQFKVS